MTTQDTLTIIGGLGFPIFLILSLMIFIDRRLFPSAMKYLQDKSSEEMRERKERHAEYIDAQRSMTAALDRLGEINKSFIFVLETHDKNSARNYAEIMARLDRIPKPSTGPLPSKGTGQT